MLPTGRIASLDGLRGLAVLAVMGIHVDRLAGGRVGVDIFFVLSGYLITGILVHEWQQTGSLALLRFYARRMFRLFPALLVVLAVVAVWSHFADLFAITPARALAAATFYFANLQITHLVPIHEPLGPLTHTWSLSIEEQYYLVWPLVLLLGLRLAPRGTGLAVLCVAGAAAVLVWRLWLHRHGVHADRIYFGTDTHCDGLLLGSALGLLPPDWRQRLAPTAARLAPLACWTLVWLVVSPFQRTNFAWFVLSAAAASTAVLILALPVAPRLAQFFSAPALIWFGTRSYSLYLWHFLFMWGTGLDGLGLPAVVTPLVEIAISLLLAELSYRCVEQPLVRLGRRLTARPGAAQRDAAPAPAGA
jgi:peptidoglycan/LPS O-acetylase OafA/YrhL